MPRFDPDLIQADGDARMKAIERKFETRIGRLDDRIDSLRAHLLDLEDRLEGETNGGSLHARDLDEGLDDFALEAVFEVEHVVGDAEVLRDMASVIHVVERAAAANRPSGRHELGHAALVPKLHGHADDRYAVAVEKTGDG